MATRKTYACGRCGKAALPEQMLWSRWTKQRYCTNLDGCAKRAARHKTKGTR